MNNKERSIVGYVRSYTTLTETFNIQVNMIQTYCENNGLICENIYQDCAPFYKRKTENIQNPIIRHLTSKQWHVHFAEWEEMLLRLINNEISCILVDTKLRLYNTEEQRTSLERLCQEHNVEIIEVNASTHPADAMYATAVYHFANHPYKRPRVVLNDVDALYQHASQFAKNWEVALYLEFETTGKKSLGYIKNNLKINTLVVKSLFHINRKIHPVIDMAQKHSHLQIASLEEGILQLCSSPDNPLLQQPLRVLIYNRYLSAHEEDYSSLQMDIYKAFVRLKTNWTFVGVYIDETFGKRQGNWLPLTQFSEDYDVVLVESFYKFDINIHSLKKIMQQINKPIYSMKEGEIQFYERN